MSSGRRLVRWLGVAVALSLLAAVGVSAGVWWISERRLEWRWSAEAVQLVGDAEPAAIERGRRLATGVALCTFCHGSDLGGKALVDDRWIGRLYAPNLTTGGGGVVGVSSDRELEQAIRRGIGRDGRSLLLMPAEHLAALTDGEVGDLIAFLRAAPTVEASTPDRWVGPLTRLVLVAGLSPELLAAERAFEVAQRPREPVDPGARLIAIGSCRVCHRDDLRGGLHPLALPDEPDPPDITVGGELASWTPEQFRRVMRTGLRPDGRLLDPRFMPWPQFSRLGDAELDAIWRYLMDPASAPEGAEEQERREISRGTKNRRVDRAYDG